MKIDSARVGEYREVMLMKYHIHMDEAEARDGLTALVCLEAVDRHMDSKGGPDISDIPYSLAPVEFHPNY